MSSDPVSIYSAANPQQAHLLRQSLAKIGIDAWVEQGLEHQLGHPDVSFMPRVLVRRSDAEEARQIALEFEAIMRLPHSSRPGDDLDDRDEHADETIDAWPQCPQCQAKRHASCRVCGGIGDYFPSAAQADEPDENIFACGDCDDVATIRMFRYCATCNHDFGTGYVPPRTEPIQPMNHREFVAILCMGGVIVALFGYFYWLFSG